MRIAKNPNPRRTGTRLLCLLTAIGLVLGGISSVTADELTRRQAKRIHDRLAGVPPTNAVLDQMETLIDNGDPEGAANIAMQNPAFYNVTLKNFVTPWTNEEQTVFAPLNDYTATVIGIIRDDLDFRQVLYGDILYVGAPSLGLPAYSTSNNNHYGQMEAQAIDMSDPANLVQATQSAVTGLPADATAGVITTRAAARAFFVDGTNRAMFNFTLLNHLCIDMNAIKDNTRPSDRIRRDATRSPGGDSRIFMNACLGCHAGMDPLVQAYAYYDWSYTGDADTGMLDYNAVPEINGASGENTRVQTKYHINENNFKWGYHTPDDSWSNYWRRGPNAARFGWGTCPGTLDQNGVCHGQGAKSMGMELANSEAFATCQVEKVYKAVCFRPPSNAELDATVTLFKTGGGNVNNEYRLKQVFARAAVDCMGN